MSCGVGRRLSSDPTVLWLGCRRAATAPMWPPALELPYAAKRNPKSKMKQNKTTNTSISQWLSNRAGIQTHINLLEHQATPPGPFCLYHDNPPVFNSHDFLVGNFRHLPASKPHSPPLASQETEPFHSAQGWQTEPFFKLRINIYPNIFPVRVLG